eukprot:NODE_761_length_4121_cov_0.819741.p3 type:complete len:173 gc:universal NODE_761_length_4121_cov_0.819741:2566-2048(-)
MAEPVTLRTEHHDVSFYILITNTCCNIRLECFNVVHWCRNLSRSFVFVIIDGNHIQSIFIQFSCFAPCLIMIDFNWQSRQQISLSICLSIYCHILNVVGLNNVYPILYFICQFATIAPHKPTSRFRVTVNSNEIRSNILTIFLYSLLNCVHLLLMDGVISLRFIQCFREQPN